MSINVSATAQGVDPGSSRAVLRFLDGELEGREFSLEGEVSVGRDPDSGIVLPGSAKRASAAHAILRPSEHGSWVVEDLGSRNGTYLNDGQIAASVPTAIGSGVLLRFGDRGPTARFVIRSAEAELQAARPTMGYSIALARAETLHTVDARLEWRDKPIISLGRDPQADISFTSAAHRRVSGRHARIRFSGRGYLLEDQSTHGTFVNGERVSTVSLEPGDVIELSPGGPKLVVERVEVPGRASTVDVDTMQSALDDLSRRSGRRTMLLVGVVGAALVGAGFGVRHLLRTYTAAPEPVDSSTIFKQLEARHSPSLLLVYCGYRVTAMVDGEPHVIHEESNHQSFGTAFFVSIDGYAITNRHVVEPWLADEQWAEEIARARSIFGEVSIERDLALWSAGTRAMNEDRTLAFDVGYNTHQLENLEVIGFPPGGVKTVAMDELELEFVQGTDADLALLRVEHPELAAESIAPLLGAQDVPETLSEVMSIGFPNGRDMLEGTDAVPSLMTGRVKKVERTYQLDISVYPGNSGSPVLDLDGRIIGVTTRTRRNERHGECIPAQRIRDLIDYHGVLARLP